MEKPDSIMGGLVTVLLLYLYYFLEWIFFITKPSFLSALSTGENLSVLFLSPLPSLVLFLLAFGTFNLLDRVFKLKILTPLVPVLIACAIIFILLDNFTHTLFGFFVGSFLGAIRFLYAFMFVLLFFLTYRRIFHWLGSEQALRRLKGIAWLSLVLPTVTAFIIWSRLISIEPSIGNANLVANSNQAPNIFILSADGLNAENMSAYGYARDTTPFIDTLVKESLFAENSFSNNSKTTGSIGALLSGKLPSKTGVIFPPNIFRGIHTFQHFSGLLKRNGYRNIDLGVPFYADAFDLNMQDAFESTISLEYAVHQSVIKLPRVIRTSFSSEIFFHSTVIERISSRLLHAFSIIDMIDPYEIVTDERPERWSDNKKLQKVFEFIEEDPTKPFMAHVHLMATHGPRYRPLKRHYSNGQKQEGKWAVNFYDDVILDFDHRARRVVKFLEQRNLLDNTIFIITSDHASRWLTHKRIPLIIRFPYGQHKGRISANTQRADIPPTILAYMSVDKPGWMDGNSLISEIVSKTRPIFVTRQAKATLGPDGFWRVLHHRAPFFSMGGIALIHCDRLFDLDLSTNNINEISIESHTDKCGASDLISTDQAYEVLVGHLSGAGYDLRTLENR